MNFNPKLRAAAYATEQGTVEEEALEKGKKEKSKEFVEKGRGGLHEVVS